MKKKYQVFVSSTYNDLIEERREVMQALLELDCIPTGMELFQASDIDQWNWIKQVIDDCDYFIVILAGRYGSIHPDYEISYTEMEYKYALECKKPVIGFVYNDISLLPLNKSETDPQKIQKLNSFRAFVCKKLIKYWSNAYELSSVVSRSMVHLIETTPTIGWIRADILQTSSPTKAGENRRQPNENRTMKNKKEHFCNFCKKSQHEIEHLIAGEDVYICNECVDLCKEILNDELKKASKK